MRLKEGVTRLVEHLYGKTVEEVKEEVRQTDSAIREREERLVRILQQPKASKRSVDEDLWGER